MNLAIQSPHRHKNGSHALANLESCEEASKLIEISTKKGDLKASCVCRSIAISNASFVSLSTFGRSMGLWKKYVRINDQQNWKCKTSTAACAKTLTTSSQSDTRVMPITRWVVCHHPKVSALHTLSPMRCTNGTNESGQFLQFSA